MYNIIKKPLVSEKNSMMAETDTFVFEVDKNAKKDQIKRAIERTFSVKVLEVRTSVCRDRARRSGKQQLSKIRYWKKAMVKLRPGQKISIFEGV